MKTNATKRFYPLSIAVLAVLSSYPLINGVRMAIISNANGSIEPDQYAKYVVPYAAICVSLLLYAVLQPLFHKAKQLALPLGLALAYSVFFAVERFFETMQIHVAGMTLIDAASLSPDPAGSSATVDIWQAALCVVSPEVRGQSLTYAVEERYYYILGGGSYKIHYYLISLILITMVSGLIYGISKALRSGDASQKRPLILRGISTAALVSLCVFANATAFFRQAAPIQTTLASILTGAFFVVLGAAAGIYAGSFLLKRDSRLGIGLPVLIAFCAAILMYIGESSMMGGNLYRFGTGWLFNGLPMIALAPVDILIVVLSGTAAFIILRTARKHVNWPGNRTMISVIAICAAIAATGPAISAAASNYTDDDIFGCYVFDRNIYTNPLSSFMALGGLPYVYGFDEDMFIIADAEGGGIRLFSVEYYRTPVDEDEFSSKTDALTGAFFSLPGLTRYKERYLLAVMSDGISPSYGLYRMDSEYWLVELGIGGVWSIYRLVKTEATTLADLGRAVDYYAANPPIELLSGNYEKQITLKDVYSLARKGDALELHDFEPFYYHLYGPDFKARRYDTTSAETIFVDVKNGMLESALLWSRRTVDLSQVIDLREGFESVAEYLDPLGSLMDITIERGPDLDSGRELLFEDDYFMSECRYYINYSVDETFVVFNRNERMTVKEALAERRITIEDAAANGLYNVFMVPIDNPLGGEFCSLHHRYAFSLNGEAFYPPASFMYIVEEGAATHIYYNIDDLIQFLDWYGYGNDAEKLSHAIDPGDLIYIARGNYVSDDTLAGAGIESDVGWWLSSHTPVEFVF